MNGKLVTPAEAMALWYSVENPSHRKIADRFTAAGRPVSRATIGRWRRNGWAATLVQKAVAAAVANMDRAAPALTGDVRSTTADIVAARAKQRRKRPDTRSHAERNDDALHTAISCATTVLEAIRAIAIAELKGKDEVVEDMPPTTLLGAPDGLAKLMMAAMATINMAIEGGRQLAVARSEEATAVPGAQTVYPPGHGPHAERSHADGFHEQDYLPHSTIESIDQAIKEFREQNGAVAAPRGAVDAA